ncbi:MAG: NADH-quinone oxidoreductase subunit C [Acidobacteriota bacterium]
MTDERPPETPEHPEEKEKKAADAESGKEKDAPADENKDGTAAAEKQPAAKPAAEKPAAAAKPAGPKPVEPSGEVVETDVTRALGEKFGGAVKGVANPCGEATVSVEKARLIDTLTWLHDDPAARMDYLSDLTAVHYPNNEKKIEVVYHLYSIEKNHSLRVRVPLDEGESCPTATGIWRTADWHEREVHDLMGVVFDGHPNLVTILLPEGWEDHPLRKEYPLGGAQEEEIRANAFGRPGTMSDDLDEVRKIIKEYRYEP